MTASPLDPSPLNRALQCLDASAARSEGSSNPPLTSAAAEDFRAALEHAPGEVRRHLDRLLMGPEPELGLDALLECGALQAILPEVAALVGFGDGEWRHKDVWKHTKQVVAQSELLVTVRWAALLHDIGKIRTRTISPDGEVHFFGHAELGARMFDKLARRLKLFRDEPQRQASIRFLVLHHLRANQYEASWTDSAVRRFARELGAELPDLLLLAQADITTKRPEKRRRGLKQIEELGARITELAQQDAIEPPLPGGVGDLIMQAFDLPPSRLIGTIKRTLEIAVEDGEIPPYQPGEFYVEFIRSQAARFGIPT